MGVGVAVVGVGAAVVLAGPVALTGLIASAAAAALTSTPSPVTLGPGVPEEYRADLLAAGERCPRLTPSLLAAQVEVESDWNPKAAVPGRSPGPGPVHARDLGPVGWGPRRGRGRQPVRPR